MNGVKRTKILLGWPWYDGPDVDAYPAYLDMIHYFGRLQERSMWLQTVDNPEESVAAINHPIDMSEDNDEGEITKADGIIEFGYQDLGGSSLVGWAREKIVEAGLKAGYDYLFMFDDDMQFPAKTLMRFIRHNKPVVNALAFTSSQRPEPCIYKVDMGFENGEPYYKTDIIYDYPEDSLICDEDIGGILAHGAGVTLYNMNIFRQIPKPWFSTTGCGEDWFFCLRAYHHGVRRFVDTGVFVNHKDRTPKWNNAGTYKAIREEFPEWYAARIEQGQSMRKGGIVS